MHIKAYAILCAILALAAGFYFYQKWQEFHFASEGVRVNKAYIEELRKDVVSEKNQYDKSRDKFDGAGKALETKLATIFPADDNYTILTRQVDAFEYELANKKDQFEVSNIDFDSTVETEKYSILPMRMNIRSSADNFTKFLHWMENAGSLSDEVRLMDISSIRLNFEEGDEGKTDIINFSVQVNAYFQK